MIRRRLGEMFSDMDVARHAIYYAAWYSDTYGPGAQTFSHFLKAKYIIGRSVSRTLRNASIACGIHGLMKDHPFERILRDGTTASIMPPNEDACLENIGLIEAGLDPKEVTPFLKEEER
jgi:alkylation response protein AidB-like acyl-CoA dehydrogenase